MSGGSESEQTNHNTHTPRHSLDFYYQLGWGRLQSVWKYVQRAGGLVPAMKDLSQQSLLRTDGD
jgi:hypothetical protein